VKAWKTLATSQTAEGVLELRQRGDADDYLIVIGGRVLMNSHARKSEEELARLGIKAFGDAPKRVLIAGLGMGYTLRAALDALPADAEVVVCEIDKQIVEWCKGPLAAATGNSLDDPRVRLELADVAARIANSKNTFDVILLDLYEGPNAASQHRHDPFYSAHALVRTRAALRPGGILAVWSEDVDAPFAKRFVTAGFTVKLHSIGAGGRKHAVYVGTSTVPKTRR
jgi:spermidine synthase